LNELMSEGLSNKLSRIPDDERLKLQETIERVINEGSGGLICIIL
jgi:stage IV sporulation protein A